MYIVCFCFSPTNESMPKKRSHAILHAKRWPLTGTVETLERCQGQAVGTGVTTEDSGDCTNNSYMYNTFVQYNVDMVDTCTCSKRTAHVSASLKSKTWANTFIELESLFKKTVQAMSPNRRNS